MDPTSLTKVDDHSGFFTWYLFNGTTEPTLFKNTPEYAILNKTYYGSGNYFNMTLESNKSSTRVYYYSNDAFADD